MKEKLFFRKLKFFAVVILPFAIIACNRTNPAPSMPAASPQLPATPLVVSEQVIEVLETPVEAEAIHSQNVIHRLGPVIRFSDVFRLHEPITELHMIFVEGGSMMMQGQEISLDSFYISRYVLNVYLNAKIRNFAVENGYEIYPQFPWPLPSPGAQNTLLSWNEAIIIANWLSIMEGLRPVYLRGDKLGPILSYNDLMGFGNNPVIGETGAFIIFVSYFYIDWEADGYRLPTEAEWEFAARGGNLSRGYRYSGSDKLTDVLTNIRLGFPEIDYIPGQRKPNELGIHDMSGQSPEWVLGPWTEFGELKPLHNPGQISRFDFLEAFYHIQKGGNPLFMLEHLGHSPHGPEDRRQFQPYRKGTIFDSTFQSVSVRFVRSTGILQVYQGESGNYE